jgi:hypothetical protein
VLVSKVIEVLAELDEVAARAFRGDAEQAVCDGADLAAEGLCGQRGGMHGLRQDDDSPRAAGGEPDRTKTCDGRVLARLWHAWAYIRSDSVPKVWVEKAVGGDVGVPELGYSDPLGRRGRRGYQAGTVRRYCS